MNILVIVGSPKGKDSITLHTCLYLEKQFPEIGIAKKIGEPTVSFRKVVAD